MRRASARCLAPSVPGGAGGVRGHRAWRMRRVVCWARTCGCDGLARVFGGRGVDAGRVARSGDLVGPAPAARVGGVFGVLVGDGLQFPEQMRAA